MKRNSIPSIKDFIIKIWPILRIFIGLVALFTVGLLAFKSIKDSQINIETLAWQGQVLGTYDYLSTESVVITSPVGTEYELKEPDEEEIQAATIKYEEKIKRIEEEKRRIEEAKRREKMIKVENLSNFLKRMGSPMSPHAEIILDSCEKYGTHYCKFFLSIAGVESGFGRVCPAHNAWGWGGIKFPSWEYSIPYVADQIAQKYYLKGCNTFEVLAYSPYGPKNPEKWIGDLYYFFYKIPL